MNLGAVLPRDLLASTHVIPEMVQAFVRQLPVPCAVVTSSARMDVERILRNGGLLDRFGALICGEDVDELKPAPNAYQKAPAALGLKRALAVEDSDAGVQSATAAGIEVLKVPSPNEMPSMLAKKLYGHRPAS